MSSYKKLNGNYDSIISRYHKYLLNNLKRLLEGLPWNIKVIKKLKIGYDSERKCFVFPIYDQHSNLVNIFWHKSAYLQPKLVPGAPSKLLYPMNLLKDFAKNELLIYAEGLKDVLTLLSKGYNAVTNTNGVLSIPDDLSSFEDVKEIIIIYDSDKPGRDGQEKLAERLKRQNPDTKVKLIQWGESYPDGFDITDYVLQGESIDELINNTVEFYLPPKGYKTLTTSELLKAGFKNPPPIVKDILQQEGVGTLAGTDGVGKSFYALQFACHCAVGIEFLGYEIQRPWKVLLINYELSMGQIAERFEAMKSFIDDNYNLDPLLWDNLRINLLDKEVELFKDQWDAIEETIIGYPECEIVIIDNLYTSALSDLSDNKIAQQLWGRISQIKIRYNVSFLLVNHHTKNFALHKTLHKDMIRAGKSFTDFCTNVVQLGQSTHDQDKRILKITKSRNKCDTLNIPQLLVFNGVVFENRGAIENEEIHFVDVNKRPEFRALEHFEDEEFFTTEEWEDYCTDFLDPIVAKRTANGWLRKLVNWKRLKRVKHGVYQVVPMEVL